MGPDVAVLASVAAGLELHLDRAGWGQPFVLLALEGTDLRPLVAGGDPFEVLKGYEAPDGAAALVVACEGWGFPRELLAAAAASPHRHGLPSDHPRRVELRLVAAVARTGDEVLVQRRRGDRQVIDRAPSSHPADDGGVVSALRRAYGLPTRPTLHRPTTFLARAWLASAVAAAERGSIDLALVLSLAPDSTLGGELTWEDIRQVALRGGLEVAAPDVAAWMDADMLAEYLASVLPTPADLLATLAALAGADLADALGAELGRRRWA